MAVQFNLMPPISSEEFRKGKVYAGPSKLLLDFLRAYQDQAFTQEEIISEITKPDGPTPESFIHFLAAMAPLQLQRLVERRLISTETGGFELYYQATRAQD